jgi:CdiI immunity protein
MIKEMREEYIETLRDFFSDCFNEDWRLEADNPDELIANYVKEVSSKETFVGLGNLILDYSKRFDTDPELEENLFSELYCYYQPSLDGISAKSWLAKIAGELKAAADSQ